MGARHLRLNVWIGDANTLEVLSLRQERDLVVREVQAVITHQRRLDRLGSG